ncbi:MAG: IscS subfamily cysteine desulfurase [Bacteroidia bacterium]
MKLPVYLDYNASTPADPAVVAYMLPFFSEYFGNASSKTHKYGWIAEQAVETAREQVASLINAEPAEIVFTSGATEAINLALQGVFRAYHSKGRHIIISTAEHKAVLDTCAYLEKQGAEISLLPVDRLGKAYPEELKKLVRSDTILVAVMHGNNETGTLQHLKPLSDIAHSVKAVFMSDTTQSCGKVTVDVNEFGIDLCCVSAHKIYGPKGTGALYVRRKNPRVALSPVMFGGGHEKGLRSGTLNVAGIAGLGKAAEIAASGLWEYGTEMSRLRTLLEQQICDNDFCFINGSVKDRLPNTTSITFPGIRAEQLIARLPDYAFSTGSACTSASDEPSHVLLAMGLSDAEARATIRLSLGKKNTTEEILAAAAAIRGAVSQLRSKA